MGWRGDGVRGQGTAMAQPLRSVVLAPGRSARRDRLVLFHVEAWERLAAAVARVG